jgi:hypothetical protein
MKKSCRRGRIRGLAPEQHTRCGMYSVMSPQAAKQLIRSAEQRPHTLGSQWRGRAKAGTHTQLEPPILTLILRMTLAMYCILPVSPLSRASRPMPALPITTHWEGMPMTLSDACLIARYVCSQPVGQQLVWCRVQRKGSVAGGRG